MYSLGRMLYWLLTSLVGLRHHLPDTYTIEAEVGPWQIRKQRPLGHLSQMLPASPVTVALPLPGAAKDQVLRHVSLQKDISCSNQTRC